ncbi:MAG TPA: ABC transporter ATP-binding protein [Candidatus Limnocylindrales bacterium]|nr:ABC transporter ATP-binding protein [Candidatus Limnocylindrales bacterium]
MLGVFFLSILATLFGLGYPLFTKFFIDEVLLKGNTQLLVTLTVGMFVIALLGFLLAGVNRYLYTWISARILFDMRMALYRHLQGLSLRFYTRTKIGEILARINTDLAEIQRITTDVLLSSFTNLLTLMGTLGFLLWLNYRLFLVSSLLLPWVALGLRYFRPRIADKAREIRDRNADLGSFLIETFQGIKLIKAFGAEELEVERFARKHEAYIQAVLDLQKLSIFSGGISGLLLPTTSLLVFLYGGHLVITGSMTLGDLIAFSAYLIRAFGPLQGLLGLYVQLQRARISLQRVFELMTLEPEVKEKEGAISPESIKGEVEFEEVSFEYEPGKPVLQNVSFRVPAGTTVAIVGPSGMGKTTLIDLLLRFYDPQKGSIKIDGIDLRDLKIRFLRDHIGVVGQETFLFHATIEENIRYGKNSASREEVIRAAQAAYIHDFIESLPQKYETIVGERGVRLSGGERQRVAIARAILKSPRILILDEATSSLDWMSEQYVRTMLAGLMRGRTTIIVTHRLSSVQNAHQILVLHEGQIIQQGIHEDLLKVEGLYRQLYEAEVQTRNRSTGDPRPETLD